MSRRRLSALLALAVALSSARAGWAQDGQTGSPPERIDLTVTTAPPPLSEEECRRRREAAVISGEIVVCGSRPGDTDPRYSSNEEAANRYAEKTKNQGTLPTPDVAGPGIFRGPATVSGICVPGIFNCPKAPAIFVDVRALPQAPPGSDADRIARGLPPLGEDRAAAAALPRGLSAD